MAKKKSKAQRKEERRRAMARKRRQTGWQPPPAPDWEQDQVAADMSSLLFGTGENDVPHEELMIPAMEKILNSDDLIQEPEFDGVYADPFVCLQLFSAALEAEGLGGAGPDQLPVAQKEDVYPRLIEELSRRILIPEVQEAILAALQDLRTRAREEGQEALMAQAAGVGAFLDEVRADEVWAQIGVVQAVARRSLSAGIDIYRVTAKAAEGSATGRGIERLLGHFTGATPKQSMEDVLAKYPGLENFLSGELQGTWEEGVAALASGVLDLGLFSQAEVSAAFEGARSLGVKLTAEGDLLIAGTGSEEEKIQAFASWLSGYVDELATRPRLARMQARLGVYADTAPPSELAFLSLLNEEFEGVDRADRLRPVLERALVGEMRKAVVDSQQEEG